MVLDNNTKGNNSTTKAPGYITLRAQKDFHPFILFNLPYMNF